MTILDTEADHAAVYAAIREALGAALALTRERGREDTPVFREAYANAYGCPMKVSIVVEFDEREMAKGGER